MIAVIQRVQSASVTIDGSMISSIPGGMLILLCVVRGDTEADLDLLVKKCAAIRIFDDENGVMNLSPVQAGASILCVSQFTLAASVRKGNRPSYIAAAGPAEAAPVYDTFCARLSEAVGTTVRKGVFGADMKVALVNDGPVTIIIDTKKL